MSQTQSTCDFCERKDWDDSETDESLLRILQSQLGDRVLPFSSYMIGLYIGCLNYYCN